MAEKPDTFSLHEWDVGGVKAKELHICMCDATPFWERSKSLPPGDAEDMRRHLGEQVSLGAIKEIQFLMPLLL